MIDLISRRECTVVFLLILGATESSRRLDQVEENRDLSLHSSPVTETRYPSLEAPRSHNSRVPYCRLKDGTFHPESCGRCLRISLSSPSASLVDHVDYELFTMDTLIIPEEMEQE